jgi:hypothetical protein
MKHFHLWCFHQFCRVSVYFTFFKQSLLVQPKLSSVVGGDKTAPFFRRMKQVHTSLMFLPFEGINNFVMFCRNPIGSLTNDMFSEQLY